MSALLQWQESPIKYRLTSVETTDYGDGPGAGQTSIGTFAAISDGKHWQSRPAVMKLLVPLGTRPGAIVTLTATAEEPTHDQ